MNLSNTSSAFLRELHKALEGVERSGPEWESPKFYALIGNGGSMAIAQHVCNDLNKNWGPAYTPDVSTLSCLANDFGWENALKKWVENQETDGALIAISSSGHSQNIINACEAYGGCVITFTGFYADNPIRKIGHTNYWVPSRNYGIVECAHLAILHSIFNPGKLMSLTPDQEAFLSLTRHLAEAREDLRVALDKDVQFRTLVELQARLVDLQSAHDKALARVKGVGGGA